eukprot:scaffold130018_cov20-Tisochrysis_lutea.AAC.2
MQPSIPGVAAEACEDLYVYRKRAEVEACTPQFASLHKLRGKQLHMVSAPIMMAHQNMLCCQAMDQA